MFRFLLIASAILLAPAARAAQTAEEFYKGKTITYIVATDPGGGYDTYGRLLVRTMARLMPDTKVIIRNLPGAGHIVGANTIYIARPDGLTIGTFNTGLIYQQLLKDPAIRFDLTKMSWIGKAADDTRVLVLSKSSGNTSVDQLLDPSKPKIKLYAAGVGSAAYVDTKLAGGSGDNKIPLADQYAKDDLSRRLLKMIAAESDIARLTAGPPNIPADRLALLRQVYLDALADPRLQSEAKKMDLPIVPAGGEKTRQVIADALAQTPETIAMLARAVKTDQ